MAEFLADSSGLSDLIKQIEKLGDESEKMQAEMIDAEADLLVDLIQEEGARTGYHLENVLRKVKKSKKPKRDKKGLLYKVVTVTGNHRNGQRNAVIAFVANYGRQKKYGEITGSYFWTRAVKRAKSKTKDIYEEKISEMLKERGLM